MAKQSERFKVVPKEKRSTTRFLARMVPGAQPAPIAGFVAPCVADAGKGAAARRRLGPRDPVRGTADRGAVGAEPPGALRCERQRDDEAPRLASPRRCGGSRSTASSSTASSSSRTPTGRSDPAALARDLADGRQDRLVYYVFDLLHLDGFDITDAPLVERKRVLKSLLDEAGEGPVAYSEHLDDRRPRDACPSVKAMGLAGIVSKRADAPYVVGRDARTGRDAREGSSSQGPASRAHASRPPRPAPAAPKAKARNAVTGAARCSSSTATPSPTAPITPCRSRCAAPTARAAGRSSASPIT